MKLPSKPRLALILAISVFFPLCITVPTLAQTQANLQHTLTNTAKIYGAVWSPDGNRAITWREDDQAVVWDANTGTQLFSITHGGLFGSLISPRYSPDGKQIASFQDKTLFVWDAETGSQQYSTDAFDNINGITWNHTGTQILAWSNPSSFNAGITKSETVIEVWEPQNSKRTILIYHEGALLLEFINFSPDNSMIAALFAGEMGGIRVWNTIDGSPIHTLWQDGSLIGGVGNVEWSDDGTQILFAGINGAAFITNQPAGEHMIEFQNNSWIREARWSPDKSRILGVLMLNRILPIWDAESGDLTQSLRHTHYITDATWSRNSLRILTWSTDGYNQGSINVWDAQTGVKLLDIAHEVSSIQVEWNATESLLLGWFINPFQRTQSGSFNIWDTITGEMILSEKHKSGLINEIPPDWSPDGNRLLSWQENQAFIWKFE